MEWVPRLLTAHGPVKEGDVGAGRAKAIGIEQVVGRGIVLVHGFLDHAEAQGLRIEIMVAGGIGGDGGEVVQAIELHFVSYRFSHLVARVTSFWVRLCPVGRVSCCHIGMGILQHGGQEALHCWPG